MSRLDPKSIAGKPLKIDERTALLVIGAGPAGLACATEAARLGQAVVLIDENPIGPEQMGDDLPQKFGGRASGAVRNRRAMLEQAAAAPAIVAAFEAGVDVRLATTCWGVYAPGPNVGWLPGPVAALLDDRGSSMMAAERIVVAAGRRDMALAFPGWGQPGVVGITAALRLLAAGALDVRRAVLLGTTAEALQAALALRDAGVEIAVVVEQAAAPVGPPALIAALIGGGTALLCGAVVRRAEGADGITGAIVGGPEVPEQHFSCDTILLGVGCVPVIELLDAAGCRVGFDATRGGVVPRVDAAGRTSLPGIAAIGDCAGIWPEKSLDTEISREEGRRAARAQGGPAPLASGAPDLAAYRTGWVRASVIEAAGAPHVCLCEEVTAREILEVRPPRYLGAADDRRNDRTLTSMLGAGPPDPDQVKRLTRAGMGLCQGRRCREQVAALLALGAGVPLERIPPATHRAPVRPIPLRLAAAGEEPGDMAAQWDTWFGMPSQYRPHWEAIMPTTAATRDDAAEVASE